MIEFNVFKGGKPKIVTFSFDDGVVQDRKLIEIFNKYGIKGTFNLNSSTFGRTTRSNRTKVNAEEVATLYKGHEVACHGLKHDTVTWFSEQNCALDTFEDRRNIEALCGYPVRGFAYPNGDFCPIGISGLKAAGIEYARTVNSTGEFGLPGDFMTWNPTCHYSHALEKTDSFVAQWRPGKLFYIWGHSYEMDETDVKWDYMEKLCEKLAFKDDIWYATNIEIVDYIKAQHNLKISVDNKTVYNPSFCEVWFKHNNRIFSVKGGETIKIED